MRGFTYEQLWGHVRRACLLGPGLMLIVWGLANRIRLRPTFDLRRVMYVCSAACLLVTAVLMFGVLRGRALTDDELVYAMQASFFKAGSLVGIDLGVNPRDPFTIQTNLGYTGKYLPGAALVQIPGLVLGIPALLHLPILALTLWAWYRALLASSGERIAQLGTAALACSPMLAFTSATGLSHAPTLMWVVLLGLAVQWARAGKCRSAALLGGASSVAGFVTRPQSLLPIGAVLGTALLVALWKRRAYAAGGWLALTVSVGLGSLLWYNAQLTGSPFQLPWFLQCDPEHFGFGQVWKLSTFEHTPWTALQNLAVVAVRLNSWWLGLPLSLGVLVLWLRWGAKSAGARLWVLVGVAVVVFEFFYYSPGVSETGSIYHYELLLPGSLIVAVVADRFLTQTKVGPLALACCLLLGTATWVVEQGLRIHRLTTLIHRETDAVIARVQRPAIVIHERLPGESLARGWVDDGFRKRFRAQSDAVVTWPRVTPDIVTRVRRAYPGRHCYYFRFRPGTDKPELQGCDEAEELLRRPLVSDPDAPIFVERSTAYFKTKYNPSAAAAALMVRGPDGQPLHPCCGVREALALGIPLKPSVVTTCIETGGR